MVFWNILIHWIIQIFQIHILLHNMKRLYLLISPLISSEKSLNIRNCKPLMDTNFPKSYIFFKNSSFIIGNKCSWLFFLKWQGGFLHFWENICQLFMLNNHSLSASHYLKKNDVPWKKAPSSAFKWNTECFSSRQPHTSVCRSALCMCFSHSVTHWY